MKRTKVKMPVPLASPTAAPMVTEAHPSVVTLHKAPTGLFTKHGENYLCKALGDPAELVYNAMKLLERADPFDTMIGRGMSGALVVPMLARAMNKWFAIVRKPNDGHHGSSMVEGQLGHKWLFVDDLICSGNTFVETGKAVFEVKPSMTCTGMYMYGTDYNERTYKCKEEILCWGVG